MGFNVVSKGAPLAGLLKKFLLATPAASASALGPRPVAGASRRLFNTGALPHRRDESNVDSDGRLEPGFSFWPGGVYPFVDGRACWISKQDDDAMELKVAMMGMAKEQVKLSAYQDALVVKWEEAAKGSDGGDDDEEDEDPASYLCRISLSAVFYKLNQTKAEMKDGLLTLTVPKIKGDHVVQEGIDIKIE